MRESPKKQPGELEPDYIWEKRSQNQKSMMKPKKRNTRKKRLRYAQIIQYGQILPCI